MNKDTNPKHWKLGVFYYNPDNPSGFVDKRKGIGATQKFCTNIRKCLKPLKTEAFKEMYLYMYQM